MKRKILLFYENVNWDLLTSCIRRSLSNYVIHHADNSYTVSELLQRGNIDIVVMDPFDRNLTMTDSNPKIALMVDIKAENIPVIVTSRRDQEYLQGRYGISLGIHYDLYVARPYNIDTLAALIEGTVGGK